MSSSEATVREQDREKETKKVQFRARRVGKANKIDNEGRNVLKIVLGRTAELREAYRKIEKRADPPLISPVNGLYTEEGRPIEKISDLSNGQMLLFTCTGDRKPTSSVSRRKGSSQDLLNLRLSKPKQMGPKSIQVYRWVPPLRMNAFKKTNYKLDAHLVIKLLNSIDTMEALKATVVRKGKLDSKVPLGDMNIVALYSFQGVEKHSLDEFADGECIWAQTLTDTKPTPVLAKKARNELGMDHVCLPAPKPPFLVESTRKKKMKATKKVKGTREGDNSMNWEEQSHIFAPKVKTDVQPPPHVGIHSARKQKSNVMVKSPPTVIPLKNKSSARRSITFTEENPREATSSGGKTGKHRASPAKNDTDVGALAQPPVLSPIKAIPTVQNSPARSGSAEKKSPNPKIRMSMESIEEDKPVMEVDVVLANQGDVQDPSLVHSGQSTKKKASKPKWYNFLRF